MKTQRSAAARARVTDLVPASSGDDVPEDVPAAAPPAPRAPKRRVAVVLAASVVVAGGVYYVSHRGLESTDDAQIDADIVAVPTRLGGSVASVHFQENQRVEAGALLVELDDAPARAKLAQADANLAAASAAAHASETQAELAERDARGNLALAAASVRTSSAGEDGVLQQIAQHRAALESARVRSDEAQQNLARAQRLFAQGAASQAELDRLQTAQQVAATELERSQALFDGGVAAQHQARGRVDEARAKLNQSDQVEALVEAARARAEQARAAVAVAQAARDLAALELSYTQIKAPASGVVSKKTVEPGQVVALGQTIVQLVPDARWVTANFKETQVGHMRPGQPVQFSVDAYPGESFRGEVMSFSAATGARFALLPPDNATGNFTKVVQRIPVRIRVTHAPASVALRPGMSVRLEVDTRSPGQPAGVDRQVVTPVRVAAASSPSEG